MKIEYRKQENTTMVENDYRARVMAAIRQYSRNRGATARPGGRSRRGASLGVRGASLGVRSVRSGGNREAIGEAIETREPHFAEEAKKRQRLSEGRGKKGTPILAQVKGEARDHAATAFGVSHGYVSQAKKLKAEQDVTRKTKTEAQPPMAAQRAMPLLKMAQIGAVGPGRLRAVRLFSRPRMQGREAIGGESTPLNSPSLKKILKKTLDGSPERAIMRS